MGSRYMLGTGTYSTNFTIPTVRRLPFFLSSTTSSYFGRQGGGLTGSQQADGQVRGIDREPMSVHAGDCGQAVCGDRQRTGGCAPDAVRTVQPDVWGEEGRTVDVSVSGAGQAESCLCVSLRVRLCVHGLCRLTGETPDRATLRRVQERFRKGIRAVGHVRQLRGVPRAIQSGSRHHTIGRRWRDGSG